MIKRKQSHHPVRELLRAMRGALRGNRAPREPAATGLREIYALLQAGDLAGAEAAANALVVLEPEDVAALNLQGVVLKRRGRMEDAVASFERAAAADPAIHGPWFNLANTFIAIGQPARALEAIGRAAAINPADSETQRLLGRILAGIGSHELALQALERAEALDPANGRVLVSRAAALGRADAADDDILAAIDRAIALEPGNLALLRGKALFLHLRSRFLPAEAAYRAILERDPEDFETLLRLGCLLGYSLVRYAEGNEVLRRAHVLKPDDPRGIAALSKSLLDGRAEDGCDAGASVDEANELAHRLLACGADLMPYASTLMWVFLQTADFPGLAALPEAARLMRHWVAQRDIGSLHNLLGRVATAEDRRALVHWHREWGRSTIAAAAATPLRRPVARSTARARLRIGFMSSDLRAHPVGYFALPIFQCYDRSRFEIFCYSFHPARPDKVTAFIGGRVAAMRLLPQARDSEIAQIIADDDLDMLFELGGSTRHNRLEVMAHRLAPAQASWLGYPHSAGLETIDYILVDPYVNPPDPALLLEKPLEMPHSWVAVDPLGFRNEPIAAALPEERAGAITFGTMNSPYKYTRAMFALWAEVLRRVEGSRFLFVRTEAAAAAFHRNVTGEFASHGISPDRVECVTPQGSHLSYYNRIDIALDTAPQTGGTTTCETLWMGVPVVTLVGAALFERLSYSNLSNAGLGDLCAFSSERYVEIALALAADPSRRRELRRELRARLRGTPLGDGARWVRDFEAAIERALGCTRAGGASRA